MNTKASQSFEIWFDFASTYSYPAIVRLRRMEQELKVNFQWRPFLLGPLFQSQGWNDSPFNIYPAKGKYMWRDMERICANQGIPYFKPTAFPRNGLTAARIACRFSAEKWAPIFIEEVFRANFVKNADIGENAVLEQILNHVGIDGASAVAEASTAESKRMLHESTAEAQTREIFGAPTFAMGNELFWGGDRLEEALDWYLSRNKT